MEELAKQLGLLDLLPQPVDPWTAIGADYSLAGAVDPWELLLPRDMGIPGTPPEWRQVPLPDYNEWDKPETQWVPGNADSWRAKVGSGYGLDVWGGQQWPGQIPDTDMRDLLSPEAPRPGRYAPPSQNSQALPPQTAQDYVMRGVSLDPSDPSDWIDSSLDRDMRESMGELLRDELSRNGLGSGWGQVPSGELQRERNSTQGGYSPPTDIGDLAPAYPDPWTNEELNFSPSSLTDLLGQSDFARNMAIGGGATVAGLLAMILSGAAQPALNTMMGVMPDEYGLWSGGGGIPA
jgi:hypothetical protein